MLPVFENLKKERTSRRYFSTVARLFSSLVRDRSHHIRLFVLLLFIIYLQTIIFYVIIPILQITIPDSFYSTLFICSMIFFVFQSFDKRPASRIQSRTAMKEIPKNAV